MEPALIYISYLLLLCILVYVRQIFLFYHGLSKLTPGSNTTKHSVTVIVPARNEEQNIERCLKSLIAQRYPVDKLSIIVIDDQSTDNTAGIVKRIAGDSLIPITLFSVTDFAEIRSPKVRALTHGIQHSISAIIATTDADCVAPPDWIQTVVSHFHDTVGVVTGLTVYEKGKDISPLFWGIQFLDFLSYNAVAAGAIGLNKVLISNGSNMAFRREAFDEARGFETLRHINTGDDSLLAQKIAASGKWNARFILEPGGAVVTQPVHTWKEAFYQRMRWAGQTAYYPVWMMLFMVCTFIMFVLLTFSLPASLFYGNPIPWIVLGIKFSIDFVTMRRFTHLINRDEVLRYFVPTAAIHIPFILVSTIGGYFFSFEWKERTLKKESAA